MDDFQDPTRWFYEIPIVSRLYLCAAVVTTTACFIDVVSPLTLYYNYELIFNKGQYWRLISSFMFFGTFSLDFLFHMYFLVRYCRLLEEGFFRGRTADFLFMLLFGGAIMIILSTIFSPFSKIKFLGHPLAFMMVYIWGRSPENSQTRMNLLGLFVFRAPYLAWVLLLFSVVLGNPVETDLLGIIPGHIYYFLEFVYPKVADIRGWRVRKPLQTPAILHYLFGSVPGSMRIVEGPIIGEQGPLIGGEGNEDALVGENDFQDNDGEDNGNELHED